MDHQDAMPINNVEEEEDDNMYEDYSDADTEPQVDDNEDDEAPPSPPLRFEYRTAYPQLSQSEANQLAKNRSKLNKNYSTLCVHTSFKPKARTIGLYDCHYLDTPKSFICLLNTPVYLKQQQQEGESSRQTYKPSVNLVLNSIDLSITDTTNIKCIERSIFEVFKTHYVCPIKVTSILGDSMNTKIAFNMSLEKKPFYLCDAKSILTNGKHVPNEFAAYLEIVYHGIRVAKRTRGQTGPLIAKYIFEIDQLMCIGSYIEGETNQSLIAKAKSTSKTFPFDNINIFPTCHFASTLSSS